MHCWARYLFIAVVSVLGVGQMIAACGQKGDLYLPKPEEKAPEQAAADPKTDAAPEIQTGEELEVETEAADVPQVPAPEVPTKTRQ
jgi:predicted small lipoprotein YifL